ncbi:Chloroperoxidase [Xylariales sp. PMI_506]|nr:Chloroperoxidase [Xylariales sp. PMI_506]
MQISQLTLGLGLGLLGNAAAFVVPKAAAAGYAPEGYEWQPPTATDSRSPCPMLNTLANHGFLRRDGKNISADEIHWAFNASVHWVNDAVFDSLVDEALSASTTGNASTFNLQDSVKHDVIEHDGSLSRNDLYFGDNLHFNASIWASVAAWFTDDVISIETAAQARAARVAAAQAANPEFDVPLNVSSNTVFETALYLVTFGEKLVGNAPTSYIKAFFEDERLPYEEGYTRPDEEIISTDAITLAALVAAVSV